MPINPKPHLQIIGPFASEYSLAKVNRNLAIALKQQTTDFEISLWADQFFADKLPASSDYERYPDLKTLYTQTKQSADIAIFNSFPKSPHDDYGLEQINAPIKLAYLAWEETIFPKHFVAECNKNLHGILVTSKHVARVFRNSGITLPMLNVGEGVNLDLEKFNSSYRLKTRKKFKFLHISSGHFRKGVDILLKAYFNQFKKTDDVALVLKIFPNVDSQVEQILNGLDLKNGPELEIIRSNDLTESDMAALYQQTDAVVLPSRAEGFGLPMAEAMLMQKPLITTGYSAQTDFCNPDNSWLIDYQMIESRSSLDTPGAMVAEPDLDQLQQHMQYLVDHIDSAEVREKVTSAYQLIKTFSWSKTAEQTLEFVKYIEQVAPLKQKRLAVVSPINSPGGIAEYAHDKYKLIESSFAEVTYLANSDVANLNNQDDHNINRCWEMGEQNFLKLIKYVKRQQIDIVQFEYNPPFFALPALEQLVIKLADLKIKVFLTLHSVDLNYVDFAKVKKGLSLCDKIFVHSHQDLEFLIKKGYQNVIYQVHGIPEFPERNQIFLRQKLQITQEPVIASHGLIHDKKGLLEIIDSLKILKVTYPHILLLLVNAHNPDNLTSSATLGLMQDKIEQHGLKQNVELITDYLNNQQIITLLQVADLSIFPYADLQESASGAVPKAMSALRPVIISNSHIFKDLKAGYRIKDTNPATIAQAVNTLLKNKQVYISELDKIKKFVEQNAWESVSKRYLLRLLKP